MRPLLRFPLLLNWPLSLLLLLLSACAVAGSPSKPTAHPLRYVFNEAYGRCPVKPGNSASASVCATWKNFNANTGTFDVRKVEWGIAYAFNCGKTPRQFLATVSYGNSDGGFGASSIVRAARSARGYKMETLTNDINRALPRMDWIEVVELETACAWHIRAVEGTRAQVQSEIPPVPPLYRMNSGKIVHG